MLVNTNVSITKSFSISKYYAPFISKYLLLCPDELSEANWICRGLKNLVDCNLTGQILDMAILKTKYNASTNKERLEFIDYIKRVNAMLKDG